MSCVPTGMYHPGKSILHSLDSRAKLLLLFIMIAAGICADSWLGYGVILAAIAVMTVLSGLSPKTAFGSVKKLAWFFVLIFLMNLCFFSPKDAWISLWIFTPSYEGLVQGFTVVLRVFAVLVTGNIITSTTAPMDMTAALESLISPLRFLGLPTAHIAMIISVAIQFIPTIFEETETIQKAQTARGARFDSHKLGEKAGAVMPLVIPIFLAAFKRADELALAMEARGYRTEKTRGKKRFGTLRLRDYAALSSAILLCFVETLI